MIAVVVNKNYDQKMVDVTSRSATNQGKDLKYIAHRGTYLLGAT